MLPSPPHGEVRARSASLEPSAPLTTLILVPTSKASDGGKEICGQRCDRRTAFDARFFWDQDLKHSLEEHAKKLQTIRFMRKARTQAERVQILQSLHYARLVHKSR